MLLGTVVLEQRIKPGLNRWCSQRENWSCSSCKRAKRGLWGGAELTLPTGGKGSWFKQGAATQETLISFFTGTPGSAKSCNLSSYFKQKDLFEWCFYYFPFQHLIYTIILEKNMLFNLRQKFQRSKTRVALLVREQGKAFWRKYLFASEANVLPHQLSFPLQQHQIPPHHIICLLLWGWPWDAGILLRCVSTV